MTNDQLLMLRTDIAADPVLSALQHYPEDFGLATPPAPAA